MTTLKRIDTKLLADALKSNGGGVPDYLYYEATVKRLIKAGLLQWKPNQRTVNVSLLTITNAGKEALAAYVPPVSKFTPWFGMSTKPKRLGEYEGREPGTGARQVVHWRHLQDTPEPDWYFERGYLGPFKLWESARSRMNAWRGLREKPAAK